MKITMQYIRKALNAKKRISHKTFTVRSLLHFHVLGIILMTAVIFSSCQEFIEPDQELIKEESDMYKNWEEFRSAEMGMYALQQNLVEQLVVLGELRGDLLTITDNATPDLAEVHNFNISRDNVYASPVNFYKLIAACNKLARQIETEQPSVLDKTAPVNNYDRLYGEVLCMRAWAYFNAVRIYGKVPYIHKSLTSVNEIEEYVNSSSEYLDTLYINFDPDSTQIPDGYNNDTIRDTTIVLEKQFLDQKAVIDTFTRQLETEIKTVGVNHSIDNNDITWFVTVWNDYAWHVLLGQMYLTEGNFAKASAHFDPILYNTTSETNDIRFGLDYRFQRGKWRNIFTNIDTYEHIYTLVFEKPYQQTTELQSMFSIIPPNKYMMKPTAKAIRYWESIFDDPRYQLNTDNPGKSKVIRQGRPGDFSRGYGVSYKYYKDGEEMEEDTIQSMLQKKKIGNMIDVQMLMNNVDTVVTKYSINKDEFAHDANFIIYRAGGVHLYAAELFARWNHVYGGLPVPRVNSLKALNILNDGDYTNRRQLGVRGRAGFGDNLYEKVSLSNIIYQHHPRTNKIIGYKDYTGQNIEKQKYLVDQIMEEKAREMAYEGERFYDLMRVAKARHDPLYLAEKVASKFVDLDISVDSIDIVNKLKNPQNWYIDYFDE